MRIAAELARHGHGPKKPLAQAQLRLLLHPDSTHADFKKAAEEQHGVGFGSFLAGLAKGILGPVIGIGKAIFLHPAGQAAAKSLATSVATAIAKAPMRQNRSVFLVRTKRMSTLAGRKALFCQSPICGVVIHSDLGRPAVGTAPVPSPPFQAIMLCRKARAGSWAGTFDTAPQFAPAMVRLPYRQPCR